MQALNDLPYHLTVHLYGRAEPIEEYHDIGSNAFLVQVIQRYHALGFKVRQAYIRRLGADTFCAYYYDPSERKRT